MYKAVAYPDADFRHRPWRTLTPLECAIRCWLNDKGIESIGFMFMHAVGVDAQGTWITPNERNV